MRCSRRESHILQPAMFTSTPISKCRKVSAFNFFENSPINRSNPDLLAVPKQLIRYQNQKKEQITVFKVLGNEKIPLIKGKRGATFQKSALSHHMVVISDSEEEDKPADIYSEVTLSPNLNSLSKRKSVRMDMDQPKENVKKFKNRNTIKPLKENLLETENKKSQKRISRVDTIIDEIMKERKSTVLSPSPLVKLKSEYSVDAIVEEQGKNNLEVRRVTRSSVLSSQDYKTQKENSKRFTYEPNILGAVTRTKTVEITGKLQDIGNLNKINNIRRTRERARSTIKKEKDIQYEEDNELKVEAKKILTPLNCIDSEKKEIVKKISNCEDILNYKKNQSHSTHIICSRDEQPFYENLPVFYSQEEVSDNEWIQVNGQNGVFVKQNFHMLNISNGFVKIEAKCSLLLNSDRSQIFSVAEGKGTFVYNDNMKVKIAPGQTITIPAGFPCQIINSGLKKNLIFTFVKIYSD
ncbi:unnamed protein product [Nezara viridula]|uniref:Cupin type-1 domain-containing protein n=1 Tax=Nezara viridula TaxID=85310 RepID=A0A9P0MHT1_NEZVI|nr:unnamed protein product [Nezara viridula]